MRGFAHASPRVWNAIDIPMAEVHPDGRFLAVNPAGCRFWGRSEEELKTLRWQDITHPDDVPVDQGQVDGLASPGDTYTLPRKRYPRPAGDTAVGRLHVYTEDPERLLIAIVYDLGDIDREIARLRSEMTTQARRIRELKAQLKDERESKLMWRRAAQVFIEKQGVASDG